ncbi:MAG: substrate-binding domain-containing protein, partial [Eggerthellales bacterium]|nr:substrate-binding domain-containing protein [Eggerthellales bacterium]
MFKKTWKRVVAVALGAAMASALVVAGCSKAEDPAATDTDINQESVVEVLPYDGVELQIFAANSLSAAMPEVQALFTEKTGCTFADTQFLSSGDLNAQLEGGAYADVLISASEGKMDAAEEGGLVNADTCVNMFVNDLVIVTAEGNNDITEVTLEDVASGDYT